MNNMMDFWRSEWAAVTDVSNVTDLSNDLPTVQQYVHPDKNQFLRQKNDALQKYYTTKQQYVQYYVQIGRLNSQSTETEIWNVFSDANKTELQRLQNLVNKNQILYEQAIRDERQWNKLDVEIKKVVDDFNRRKRYSSSQKMDPNLLKALMFSETEMGASEEYKRLIKSVPISNPKAVFQLNLGRVTNGSVYNAVVKEFSIPVNWRNNYLDMGNKNDVMLAAGALILKYEQVIHKTSPLFIRSLPWYNAVMAYKGISEEGKGKANRVWRLYTKGIHPYSENKKLF